MWGRAVGCENICGMQKWCEGDPVLRLIDAALRDMALRSALYVGRRREDGDAETFVIQTGEEGRFRLRLPDPRSDASLQALVAEAQDHLAQVLGAPVPLCPRHPHALLGIASRGQLKWVCPAGEWECALGDYAERTWPQVDLGGRLAPILAARLQRRGINGWSTLGVKVTERGPVAEFGVREMSDELAWALRDAATPLPVSIHQTSQRPRRVAGLPQ
jgi:hypothetical protein